MIRQIPCYDCILADKGAAVHCGTCGCCNELSINWYFVGAAVLCAAIWRAAYLTFGGH